MLYDKEKIAIQAGKPVEFRFSNSDAMPHNLAIVMPGAMEEIGLLAEATARDADAPQRQYIPKSDKILLASRLDTREADMGTPEAVDMLGLCAEECARSGAEFAPDPACADGVTVQGVHKLLRRLVRNLLENARRYSDGPVQVTLQRDGTTHLLLRVSDRGPGVPEALRERIFEPFYRLPGASEQAGGVGLGLALVRSISERHGGSVLCTANPGGGACFVVKLPVFAAPAASVA